MGQHGSKSSGRVHERLNGLADVILLGAAVTVCALGVVTAFAGLLAAAQVLARSDDEQPVLRRFRHALSGRWRSALRLQLLWTVLTIVAAGDLLGAGVVPMSVRPIVTGVGVITLLAVVILPTFTTAAAAELYGGSEQRVVSVRATILVAVLAAAGRPLRSLAVLALVAFGAAAILGMVLLTPLIGTLAVAALKIARPAVSVVAGRLDQAPTNWANAGGREAFSALSSGAASWSPPWGPFPRLRQPPIK